MNNQNSHLLFGAITVLMILIAPLGSTGLAKTLYVDDATGNDTTAYTDNDATHPWKTLYRAANGTSGYCGFDAGCWNAGQAAQSGDTVLIASGTYRLSRPDNSRYYPILNPANSGTSGNVITFQALDPTNPPVITYASNSTGSGPMIGTYERNYVTWDGVIVQEVAANNEGDTGPVVVWASDYVTIKNSDIRGVPVTIPDNHNSIRIDAGSGNTSSNVTIQNNRIHGIGTGCGGANNPHNCAGIMIYYGNTVLIEHNEIYNSFTGIYSKGGNNTNVTIRFNEIHHTSIGIRRSFTSSSRVYQNIIRDGSSSYEGGYNGTMGIEYAEARGNCTNGTENFDTYNNTIYNVYSGIVLPGFPDRASGTGHDIKNNIISVTNYPMGLGAGCESSFPANFSADYNIYFSYNSFRQGAGDRSFATWKTNTGYDTHSITSDPLFLNPAAHDFKLQPTSPILNSGIDFNDLNNNGSTTDRINPGAYVTGSEIIGLTSSGISRPAPPSPPRGLTVR